MSKSILLFSTAVLSTLGVVLTQTPNRFSALGVTKALRERVVNGEIEISDVDTVPLPNDPTQHVSEVSYSQVKQLLAELHECVGGPLSIADFTPTPTKDSATGSRYYEYVKNDSIQASPPAPVPASSQQTFGGPAVQNVAKQPALTGESAKIVSYVQNKLATGEAPTLKQIQSRLKDTTLRCKDIASILTSSGASLTTNLLAFSLTRVTALGANPIASTSPVIVKSGTGRLYPFAALNALKKGI